jgi:hypothetical protein
LSAFRWRRLRGTAQIRIQSESGDVHTFDYTVRSKKYLEQHLRVAPGQVDLSPVDQARHRTA